MEAVPPSSHADDTDNNSQAARSRRRERNDLLVGCLTNISLVVFGVLLPIYLFLYDKPPEFSVQLAATKGLDDTGAPAPGGGAPPLSTAFDVTLHMSNRRATGRCYHGGEALVSYAGFTVATAPVPEFCVPGKGAREVRLQASADGVGLPEHVLDRMALERRVGATQLDVEAKLLRRDDGSGRPTWVWCGLTTEGARPPNAAPCAVLGLQNWFSASYLFGRIR